MAVTLTQIRAGLATNLNVLIGTSQLQVSAYMLSSPTPPTIHVYPADIDYDLAMHRGLDKWTLTVQAVVGLSSERSAQETLDAYLAPSGALSVKAAVETKGAGEQTVTLGGLVSDVQVVSCSGYRVYARESGGLPVLGAEWVVVVLASGI